MIGRYQVSFKLIGFVVILNLVNSLPDTVVNPLPPAHEGAPGQFPYHVSIYNNNSGSPRKFICGGSIYHDKYIITSSSCVFENGKPISPENLFIVAGVINLKDEEGVQFRKISEVIPHQAFDEKKWSNDIALLKLETPLLFTKHVRSIYLVPEGHTAIGTGVLIGWGTNKRGIQSQVLGYTSVDIISDEACQAKKSISDTISFNSSMICTVNKGANEPSNCCAGDRGGPLTCHDLSDTYLCGVSIFGDGCGQTDHPSVYTEISQYISWIKEMAK